MQASIFAGPRVGRVARGLVKEYVERVEARTVVLNSDSLLDLYRMFVTVVALTRALVDL